jgi:hypothetical protein
MKWILLILTATLTASSYDKELRKEYKKHSSEWSDIYEHLPTLRELAKECSSVTEIGVRSMVSTWGVLLGLSESSAPTKRYLGIDLNEPPLETLHKAHILSTRNGISFQFIAANDMTIDIEPTDLLFIDSLHTYAHLTYELEKFSPKALRYIALHDTDPPWGYSDDNEYHGDFSEYPHSINRTKRGLWPAVTDFLENHPEWKLHKRYNNNHGFTILSRKQP